MFPAQFTSVMSGQIGNTGIPIPILNIFNFEAWMTIPPPIPHSSIALHIRNHKNHVAEAHNEESCFRTILCRQDRANHPDVGNSLKLYYDYAKDNLQQMARNEEFEKSVGPVPIFIQKHLNKLWLNEKAKGVSGSLIIDKPITCTPGQCPDVAIPNVVSHTMACGIKLPLHSSLMSILRPPTSISLIFIPRSLLLS